MKNKLISIVGLTASGKTGIGIKLAKMFNGEVISSDSRQVYTGLDIGSAKVTLEEADGVVHHLIDVINPPTTEEWEKLKPKSKKRGESIYVPGDVDSKPNALFDVHMFQKMATEIMADIWSRGKVPIIVGGTGLYSRAVIEGYDYGKDGERNVDFDVLQIALMPPKEVIGPIIERRIIERIDQGMIEETKKLIDAGASKEWLHGLGLDYMLNVEYLDGKLTIDEYKYWHYTKSMQFAKRQRTWFKRERDTIFLENPNTYRDECVELVKEFLEK